MGYARGCRTRGFLRACVGFEDTRFRGRRSSVGLVTNSSANKGAERSKQVEDGGALSAIGDIRLPKLAATQPG
ncbi:hypothetical protein AAFF_G00036200 [Aldrovandia affinis]|uniref:Uncharacterized protein n=1 Tax=Aldrovandia affinis TaxID=143900 RepID=A0AAD7S398_9TELE|nr:hypothetical protein AAFF_G00036200 [Aldrovandia affinis]